MGSGGSTEPKQAVETATVDELRAALAALSDESREKVTAAVEDVDRARYDWMALVEVGNSLTEVDFEVLFAKFRTAWETKGWLYKEKELNTCEGMERLMVDTLFVILARARTELEGDGNKDTIREALNKWEKCYLATRDKTDGAERFNLDENSVLKPMKDFIAAL
eukprot:TRINITY_DN79833_c0_g1_i1.p1 TRINITY_DN79833_c0_g1~~TRINITY_DN79833_c0_g1_i1.p1  ORF type:complete len:165 (+),score=43.49 TRINITY_DN79833_c0_g1_i1:73-567(+)